jgi:REP element-mobilizing transposase RayT
VKRLPKQAPVAHAQPLERKDRVVVRQLRERAAGKKRKPGPGRPKKPGSISHRARPALARDSALHVTLKLKPGLPRLRGRKPFNAIAAAFRKYAEGNGFRLVHFSVQHDHLHLMVEADGKAMLSRGMQRLVISISRRLNLLWGEGKRWLGRLFRERYHAHRLKTPTEVRHAWIYLMHNAVKHNEISSGVCNPYSSAAYFDGYASPPRMKGAPLTDPSILPKAASWLLTIGWRKRGLIRPDETPKSAPRCEA